MRARRKTKKLPNYWMRSIKQASREIKLMNHPKYMQVLGEAYEHPVLGRDVFPIHLFHKKGVRKPIYNVGLTYIMWD